MGFDIMDLQRGRGPVRAGRRADEGRAVLKYIDVDDLVPSEDNFYSMPAIEELASLIELSGGVKQPGLVTPLGGGKYKIISGHRRRLASLQLVKQGKEAYRKMPCMVEDVDRDVEWDDEENELRAIDEAILLITTNGQREKTDWDKVQEATRLRALLERKRQFEKIPGETRKIIAEQLGTTPAQVGRYDSIEKHLNKYFTDLFAKGKIGISLAYDLSTMAEDLQHSAIVFHEKNGTEALKTLLSEWKKRTKELKVEVERESAGAAEEVQPSPVSVGAVVEQEPETPPAPEQPGERDAGKIVDFPAPVSPPPAPSAEAAPERMNKRQAANILEDLHMYCEEMLGIESERAETWGERADALAVAIAVLRK